MKKYSFRNLILGGGRHIELEGDYRRALLVGLCCFILFGISLINGILNVFIWDLPLSAPFMLGAAGGLLGFMLNRFGKYELAKHSLLLLAIFYVFIFMSNEGKYYGSQLYLFPILVASIALFGYKKVKVWIFYAVVSFVFFAISELDHL